MLNLIKNIFKNKNDSVYNNFENWLNNILSDNLPQEIIAFNFNLYEGIDNTIHIELIGADNYSENNNNWPCEAIFSWKNIYKIKNEYIWNERKEQLKFCTRLINQYLDKWKYYQILNNSKVITIGFVDWDLNIIYKSKH